MALQVLRELLCHADVSHSRVIVVSAYEPYDRIERLAQSHPQVHACLRKPVTVESLGAVLSELTTESWALAYLPVQASDGVCVLVRHGLTGCAHHQVANVASVWSRLACRP